MATNRVNAYSMLQPDAYGNSQGSTVPKGTVGPGTLKAPKGILHDANATVDAARESVSGLKEIEKTRDKPIDWGEFAMDSMGKVAGAAGDMAGGIKSPTGGADSTVANAMVSSKPGVKSGGTAMLGGAPKKATMSDLAMPSNPVSAPKVGGGLAGKMGGAAGIAGAASIATDIGGEALKKSKHEIAGGALKGVGKGAALGANPALVAATGGLSIAAGAVVGLSLIHI